MKRTRERAQIIFFAKKMGQIGKRKWYSFVSSLIKECKMEWAVVSCRFLKGWFMHEYFWSSSIEQLADVKWLGSTELPMKLKLLVLCSSISPKHLRSLFEIPYFAFRNSHFNFQLMWTAVCNSFYCRVLKLAPKDYLTSTTISNPKIHVSHLNLIFDPS